MIRSLAVAIFLAALSAPTPKAGQTFFPAYTGPPVEAGPAIPFVAINPPPETTTGLDPCPAKRLRSSVFLEGATGSMLGGIRLRNQGTVVCFVRGPLRLVLLDHAGHAMQLKRFVPKGPLLGQLDYILRPGQEAPALLQLFNGCHPMRGRLWVVLGGGEGRVDLGIGAEGRCDGPTAPPSYILSRFGPASGNTPPTPAERLQAADLRIAAISIPHEARGGEPLRFTVTIANVSASATPMRPCPYFYVELWYAHRQDLRILTREYILDCAPLAGSLAPGAHATWSMRVDVPPGAGDRDILQWGLESTLSRFPKLVPGGDIGGPFDPEPYTWLFWNLAVTR